MNCSGRNTCSATSARNWFAAVMGTGIMATGRLFLPMTTTAGR